MSFQFKKIVIDTCLLTLVHIEKKKYYSTLPLNLSIFFSRSEIVESIDANFLTRIPVRGKKKKKKKFVAISTRSSKRSYLWRGNELCSESRRGIK